MLQMKITIVDADKVVKALKKLDDDIQAATRMFMQKEGADMETEIKGSMKTGGRLAGKGPRGGKQRVHSSPGESPYVQSGRLRASIGYLLLTAKNALFMDVGAIRKAKGEVVYAHGLEVGTSKMAARPWLMPVVKQHIDRWISEIGIRVEKLK